MEIALDFEWTWVKEYFPKYFWAFLQCFENKTKAKMMYKMTKRSLMEWWD
jgi:hypothetical protein